MTRPVARQFAISAARARCMRTNRFCSLMPSRRHTASLVWSRSTRSCIVSRRPAGSVAMRASVRASSSRCSATSSGRWLRAGQAQLVVGVAGVQAVVAGTLAHQVDDLVAQDRHQPAARCRAAAEAGAAGHHRLEHIVHEVLGERRVLQAAPRVVHEEGAVLGEVAPAEGDRGGLVRGRGVGVHGGALVVVGDATVAWHPRTKLTKAHRQITSM